MSLDKLGEEFIERILSRFPESKQDIIINSCGSGYNISVSIEDVANGSNLNIGISTAYKEITVGHSFDDHEHFCSFDDAPNDDFIKEAFDYLDEIYGK